MWRLRIAMTVTLAGVDYVGVQPALALGCLAIGRGGLLMETLSDVGARGMPAAMRQPTSSATHEQIALAGPTLDFTCSADSVPAQ